MPSVPNDPHPPTRLKGALPTPLFMFDRGLCANHTRAVRAILLVHFLEFRFQPGEFFFSFAANQISNNVAGGGESALLFARFYPGSLIL